MPRIKELLIPITLKWKNYDHANAVDNDDDHEINEQDCFDYNDVKYQDYVLDIG